VKPRYQRIVIGAAERVRRPGERPDALTDITSPNQLAAPALGGELGQPTPY
jgi:hypothetical protein